MTIFKQSGAVDRFPSGKNSQTVMFDEIDTGVWIVKLGRFIPDNERWLHQPGVQAELNEAIAWTEKNSPRDTNLEELEARIK